MVSVLQDKRDEIVLLCDRYAVVRLDVFGSVLRADFRPGQSDVDLLVEFAPRDPYELADAYFDMLDDLRALLGAEVDLVMTGAVKNPYIAADIERTKQPLYAA
jgi:predicted nucleotidyltransferase